MSEYKAHTLDTILLADFILLHEGNASKAIAEGNATPEEEAACAMELVSKYAEIVGGTSARAVLEKRDEILRAECKMTALKCAIALAQSGAKAKAVEVLAAMKIKTTEEKVESKAKQTLARTELLMARIRSTEKEEKESKADADYFTKERVSVMRWSKLHIDPKTWTAAEYAYLVRSMADEAHAAQAQLRQLKSKRK